jgi:TPP-dependent 2-oxoacid decarboxylase
MPRTCHINIPNVCCTYLPDWDPSRYNRVAEWDYSGLAKVFGPSFKSKYWHAGTCEALDEVFADKEFNDAEMFRLLELKLGYLDAPANILALGPAIDEFNKKKSG